MLDSSGTTDEPAGMLIMVADVGGTNARFRLIDKGADEDGSSTMRREEVLLSADFDSLTDAARAFLGDDPAPDAACLAVAGPVIDGRCRATNLPWTVDAGALAEGLGIARVRVVNDFYAVARGVSALSATDLRVLQPGRCDDAGPRLILGAGTGLGVALALAGNPPEVLASEGGHTGFAPRSEEEDALLAFLRERHGRVSVERVVSGPGLAAIYDFIIDSGRATAWPELQVDDASKPTRITRAAPVNAGAALALDLFVSLYGAAVGDLALSVLPTGGLFLAGGIAPQVLHGVRERLFLQAMCSKGRMRPLMETTRVTLIEAGDVGLRGAALACLD